MDLVLEKKIALRTNDFDYNDHIKASAILDIFQDMAGIHATALGLGFLDMLNKNKYWVLLRTKFEVLGELKPLTDVIVKTYPKKPSRIDFNREYAIYSIDGKLLVKGISKWVIIDSVTRRLSREQVSFPGDFINESLYDDISKITIADNDKKIVYRYQVRKTDIDHNRHMNNARYAEILLDVEKNNELLKEFQIEHIKEAMLDDIIEISEVVENNEYHYFGYVNDNLVFKAKEVRS